MNDTKGGTSGELEAFLKRASLRRGKFVLASGKESDYYFDGKLTTLDSGGASLVAEALLDLLEDYEVDAVGGLTLGADPVVGAMLALAPRRERSIRGFIVRKEAKSHGTKNRIEGPLQPGDAVAIIEDVVTTGGSALSAAEVVEAFGCRVEVILAIVDRDQGGRQAFEERGYAYLPLFRARDLLEDRT